MAIQIKIPLLSVKAAKKRKKVWIASRHASLAVAMTGTAIAFFNSLLEHLYQNVIVDTLWYKATCSPSSRIKHGYHLHALMRRKCSSSRGMISTKLQGRCR